MLKNYEINQDGIIYQVNKKEQLDLDYYKSYNSYGELSNYISYLRLGNIIGSIGRVPDSILDFGYGNGSFLKSCNNVISTCYGFDISGYQLPEGCERIDDIYSNVFDVITFFDSLEHVDDIEFVKDLQCNYICISVPHCHNYSDEWFDRWKHRRPDEHLWHFNEQSLVTFMRRMGYSLIASSNLEDTIRKSEEETNILTCMFKKL